MQEILIDILNEFGYFGVGALILIENIFPPIPSEVVLLFGGFMTTYSKINPWIVVIAATVGSYAGAVILYMVGRILNKDHLMKVVSGNIGKNLHLKVEDIEKADQWFEKRGYKTVFICRCIPILRSIISVPAGMSKMPFLLFSLLTITGSSIWNMILVFAGRISGKAWESWVQYIGWYTKAAAVVIVLGIGIWFFFYKKKI